MAIHWPRQFVVVVDLTELKPKPPTCLKFKRCNFIQGIVIDVASTGLSSDFHSGTAGIRWVYMEH